MNKLMITTALLSLTVLPNIAESASDKEFQAIKGEMNSLVQRLNNLETENKKLKANVNSVKDAVNKKTASGDTIKLPGSDTTVKLGGYVKADFINDIGTGYGGDFAKFAAIPLDGAAATNKSGAFVMHARQSRFNVSTLTPSSYGDIKIFAEVDFYGTRGSDLVTNGHAPELRQAYGQVGGLLAGQTWSSFIDLATYPESLDFVGPAGVSLMRQTQLRYSGSLDNNFDYIVAIENPNSDFTNGSSDTVTGYERLPDAVFSLTKKADWGHVSLRTVARNISVQNETTGQDDSVFGYAMALSSKIKLSDNDNLKLRAAYGDGMGRYIYDVAVSSKSAGYNNNKLKTQTAFAGYADFQHSWSDVLRSNLIAGYTNIDNDTVLVGTGQNKSIWSAHANLIWAPTEKYNVGVEYMHGSRELDSGVKGDLDRVMMSLIYKL